MNAPIRTRGLVSVRVDGDVKDKHERLLRTVEEFRASNDARLTELEKRGSADVVLVEKVDRQNAEITKLQTSLDDVSASIAALKVGGSDDGKPLSAERREHARAFNQFFRNGAENGLRDLEVKAALRTDSDPDGGYVVPDQMESTIDRVLGTVSAMRSISRVMSISAGTYKKLVNQGGATGGWVGERQARPGTGTPTLVEVAFPAMELYANPAATQTLLDDSRVNIEQWLADEVSITFAEMEGAAFVTGDGVNKPRGLLSYDTVENASYAWGKLGYVVSGVAAAMTDATHNGADALTDLVYSIKQGYRQNARFLMNRKTQAAIRKFKSKTEELYLWQPSIQAGQPATILGYPVTDDDNMPDATAGGNFPIAFGDFQRGYLIVDRMGVRVLRDPFTNKPYVHFYTTKRVGGGVQNFEALKLFKIGTT
ncbi:phage major capsid protein [Nitrobacter sp. TKz-YC01]|uniref:phage major capsid protein n=1 Tax=Nitrobacter sp. TKz-YC01 TaxID=3398703 RepID=UPI003A100B8A